MRTLIEFRAEDPNTVFESRILPCPDGLSRFMVMPRYFWMRFEVLLAENINLGYMEAIAFCFDLAKKSVHQDGWTFDVAFRELLMYYIFRNYTSYLSWKNNLANDNWLDCFAHNKH